MSTFWQNTLRLAALTILVAFFSRIPVSAQNQGQSVIRVDVNLVLVDAAVKTKAGQIMADLKQDSFELREDGAPKKVEVFSRVVQR